MVPVLGYWNIRGYVQPIRLLLVYTGTEFEEKKYNLGPPPNFDRSEWLNVKPKMDLDFPNLPYYIDDDVKLSQSVAILRYLAMKHGLDGNDLKEKTRIALIEQEVVDIRRGWGLLCYGDFEKLKPEYLRQLPEKIKAVSNFLGNNEWFGGKNLTYVDFFVYEILDVHRYLEPNYLDEFPNLKQFLSRFESLPAIEKYMKSDKFMKWPLTNDSATFGTRYRKCNEA